MHTWVLSCLRGHNLVLFPHRPQCTVLNSNFAISTTWNCFLRGSLLAASAARFGPSALKVRSFWMDYEEGEKSTPAWDLSYSEGRGEAILKSRVSFWYVTMTFPSKVQPAGGCVELQTLYGACRVFVLKSSKSQDILVKIGCFTQNGDLSNTHTPTPGHIHKFKFGFLHFGAVVRFV